VEVRNQGVGCGVLHFIASDALLLLMYNIQAVWRAIVAIVFVVMFLGVYLGLEIIHPTSLTHMTRT
jgi:hypothetical protein